jgi:TolA-binding protein
MSKKYLYALCQVAFIFCLSCAAIIDAEAPAQEDVQEAVTAGDEMRTSRMRGIRGSRGMPEGVGPDLDRMERMRARMYGGGGLSGTATGPRTSATATTTSNKADASSESLKQGKESFEAGQYEQAAAEFEAFLSKNEYGDQTPEALYYLGESYYHLGKYKEAIKSYRKIDQMFQLYSLAPNAVYKMAKCYEKLGQSKYSAAIFKKLKTKYPHFNPAAIEGEES